VAQKRYDRLTLNFKHGEKDHECAWNILSTVDNKLAYIVDAVIAFKESQDERKTVPITEDTVRKIINEVLEMGFVEKAPGQTITKNEPDIATKGQLPNEGDIDKETQALLLGGLDMFRR